MTMNNYEEAERRLKLITNSVNLIREYISRIKQTYNIQEIMFSVESIINHKKEIFGHILFLENKVTLDDNYFISHVTEMEMALEDNDLSKLELNIFLLNRHITSRRELYNDK